MEQQKNLTAENKIVFYCDKVIEYGIYALVFFVPILFWNGAQEKFEIIKLVALQTITLFIAIVFLIKSFEVGKIGIFKNLFYIPVFVYLISCIISTIFSISPISSFYGTYRCNQGLVTILTYILFFLIFANVFPKEKILKISYITILTAFIISIYAILQKVGFDFLNLDPAVSFHKRSSSFLGNPVFLGGYLVMVIPIVLIHAILEFKIVNKIIFSIFLTTMYISLLFTYSRGAYIAFIFSLLVLFLLGYKIALKNIKYITIMLLIFITFTFLMNYQKIEVDSKKISLLQRGLSTFTYKDKASSARIYTWEIALKIIRDYKFWGVGLDAFINIFPKYQKINEFSKEWIGEKFTIPNKSHNIFLQTASTSGFIGLFSFLFLITTVLIKALNSLKLNKEGYYHYVMLGIISTLVGYIIYNQFGFDTITIGFMYWLFVGKISIIGNTYLWEEKKLSSKSRKEERISNKKNQFYLKPRFIIYPIFGVVFFVGVNLFVKPLLADIYYHKSLSYFDRNGADEYLIKLMKYTIDKNPSVVHYHYDLGIFYSKIGDKSNAKAEYLEILKLQPYHTLTHFRLGEIYEEEGNFNKALYHYKKSLELEGSGHPYIAETYLGIGNIYCNKRDYDNGVEYYKKAIRLKPDIADAYNNLGNVYYIKGRLEDAISMWEKVLEIYPDAEEARHNLNIALKELKKIQK
jgi:O-antigen ligase/Tfp pilus assembly protein PilF